MTNLKTTANMYLPKGNKRRLNIGLLSIFFMSGCVVTSFNPWYKKTDLVANNLLIGQWIGKKSILTFEKGDLGYLVNYKDCEDPYNAPQDYSTCTQADFIASLMKLGDNYFLDLFPRSFVNTDNLFLNLHIRPTHSLAKVIIEKDTLKILMLDYGWMENHLEKTKDKLNHIKSDDLITLTASTEQLQAFVLEHQHEAGFFSQPILLVRKK